MVSPKERSGEIDLSRRIKIFVTAAIRKSWANILRSKHNFGHLKILEDLCTRFSHQDFVSLFMGKKVV